jgi:hypothetical protein
MACSHEMRATGQLDTSTQVDCAKGSTRKEGVLRKYLPESGKYQTLCEQGAAPDRISWPSRLQCHRQGTEYSAVISKGREAHHGYITPYGVFMPEAFMAAIPRNPA